jgi:hypothetical protein
LSHAIHHEALHERGESRAEFALNRWIAIFAAVMATLAAIVGHEASEIANKAILLKNEAVLKKTEAANQWAYYQAVSTKLQLVELAGELTADRTQRQSEKASKYTAQKDEISARAEELEKESAEANVRSAALAGPRQRLLLALGLFEVAIAVGSVTALTRQRWLFGIATLGGLAGILIAAAALLAH